MAAASAMGQSMVAGQVQRLLKELGRPAAQLVQVVAHCNFAQQGKVTMFLFEDGKSTPTFTAKIPRNDQGRQWLRDETERYRALERRCPLLQTGRLRHYCESITFPFLLEEFVGGGTLWKLFGRPDFETRALTWLARFQAGSAGGLLGKNDLTRLVDRLHRRARGTEYEELARNLASRTESLADFEIRSVPLHDDYTPGNILLDGDSVFVIDWEFLRLDGWPLEDIWWFVITSSRRVRDLEGSSAGVGKSVADVLLGNSPYSTTARETICRFADDRAIPRELISVLGIVTLLRHTLESRPEHRERKAKRWLMLQGALVHLDESRERFWDFWEF